ncbi:hypothetical protein DFH06DRAFT_716311 [Mycena polygramma]|nr:hypothetical protein DFH06DRAFT_716311 [Mycena polygramma]
MSLNTAEASSGTSRARMHPCLRGDPLPTSAQQPDLTAHVRYFTVTNEKFLSEYPYEVPPSPGKLAHVQRFHIPYLEISGLGPPPTDLNGSNLGDIYIDRSPGQFAAYGKVADGSWKRWYDPQPSYKTDTVKHPYFRSRLLWCSDASGMCWFSSTTVSFHQEKAKEKGYVSLDAEKTEETRWREAAAILGAWLGEPGEEKGFNRSCARHSTSPLSAPTDSRESSPLPVLGKRKVRGPDKQGADGKRYKALLRSSIQRLQDENDELAEEIGILEKFFDSPQLSVAEPKQFSEWVEKVVADGIKMSRNEMDPSVREYWDLTAELTADEVERLKEESMLEDAQILLGLAISEHKHLKRSELAASQTDAVSA